MILAMSLWYLTGVLAWLGVRVIYSKELYVADVMFALVVGASGPIIPLTIGSWHLSVWLETMASVLIWKKKE